MAFCKHKADPDRPGWFTCDLAPNHGGRHLEVFVASWKSDGSDLRRYDDRTQSYLAATNHHRRRCDREQI